MRAKTWLAVGSLAVLALGSAAFIQQENENLRLEREGLQAVQAEVDQLTHDHQQLETLREELKGLDALRSATRDLPGLRNEIRQLREQQRELEQLRQDIQRLAAQTPSSPPKSISDMEGFVPKESWTYGDFTTPEGALQSLYCAMREGSYQHFRACLSPAVLGWVSSPDAAAEKRMAEMQKMIARIKGFRIAERTFEGDDKVIIAFQVAAGGEMIKFPLRRYGQEWKVENF